MVRWLDRWMVAAVETDWLLYLVDWYSLDADNSSEGGGQSSGFQTHRLLSIFQDLPCFQHSLKLYVVRLLGKNIKVCRGEGNIMAVGKNIASKKCGSNIIFPIIFWEK